MGGEADWPPLAKIKGAALPHREVPAPTPPPYPLARGPSPKAGLGPASPTGDSEAQAGLLHLLSPPSASPACGPPRAEAAVPARSPEARLPRPSFPGLRPPWGPPPPPEARDPAPTLTPRSRRDSEAAGWALCYARSRRLPWCSAAAEQGGDGGGGGWAWAPLEGSGGGGGGGRGPGGRGRERARRRARVRGSEPGFQAGQLEAGGTTRPEERGGTRQEREGSCGGGAGPCGRGRPGVLSRSLRRSPATALFRAAELPSSGPAGEEPGAPAGCGVAAAGCDAPGPGWLRNSLPSPLGCADRTMAAPPPPLEDTPPEAARWSRPGRGGAGRGGSRRWSPADQLGSGRATLFSASVARGRAARSLPNSSGLLGLSRTSLFPELLKP